MSNGVVETGESKDGTGAGDRDVAFAWGQHGSLLKPWELAHLLILRGKLKDRHDTRDTEDLTEAP